MPKEKKTEILLLDRMRLKWVDDESEVYAVAARSREPQAGRRCYGSNIDR